MRKREEREKKTDKGKEMDTDGWKKRGKVREEKVQIEERRNRLAERQNKEKRQRKERELLDRQTIGERGVGNTTQCKSE